MASQDDIHEFDELKVECLNYLIKHFGVKDSIILLEKLSASEGKNHDGHLKALVGGKYYGFKTYPEAGRKGEQEQVYAIQDFLIADIAQIVKAPNACLIKQEDSFKHNFFQGKLVNISKWHPDSVTLELISKDYFFSLQSAVGNIASDFGQWAMFGLAMGVQDRTAGQFVCDRLGRVAMIDMDYCFTNGSTNFQTYIGILRQTFQALHHNFEDCRVELVNGSLLMKEKIEANQECIAELLKGSVSTNNSRAWIPGEKIRFDKEYLEKCCDPTPKT